MKSAIKELFWLLGILIVAWLTYGVILGNSALDINMHDTYIVTGGRVQNPTTTLYIFTWFIVFGFVIYFTRVLIFGFKVVVTNVILVVFSCLCLYFLGYILFLLNPPIHFEPPPMQSLINAVLPFDRHLSSAHNWLPELIKIFLMTTLASTSFITGMNFKSGK